MKSRFTMYWLLCYISIASVSAAIITPALPKIEQFFLLNTGTVEWMVSSFLIGYVLGQLLYGPIANAYGRLIALKWGLNLNLVGLLLCLLAGFYHHYTFLLVGRFITGLGSAAGLTCTFMLINEWLPETERKIAMAYSILSFALGIGLAVMLGGIITQYTRWEGCFVFLIVQGLIMRIGLRVFSETLVQAKPLCLRTIVRDYGQALRSFKLITFSLIWGACSTVGYCFSAAAPQIAHHYLQLSISDYGYWNGLNIIGMLLGSLSARLLMHRVSIMHVISLGYLGSLLGWISLLCLFQATKQPAWWFFLSTSLLYCSSAYLFAGGSYAASNAIEDKANASSMMSFINMSVATLSVVIMGYLSRNPFIGFLLILALVFFITLLILMIFFFKHRYAENHSLSSTS